MRIYYDTEFVSLYGNTDWDLISVGFVAETGVEWYVELKDFIREDCSEFVVEFVLPLLGKGDRIPVRMGSHEFGWQFVHWLRQFDQPIELVSDSVCDWSLVNAYSWQEFKELGHKVQGQLWQPSDLPSIKLDLAKTEAQFWMENKGMQHHALYDARRLKLIAERQAALHGAKLY